MEMITRQQSESTLKQIFRLPSFYDRQWEVISQVMAGNRVLFVEKTGYGKSLCFQFPATQFPGMTVVFSPLLALMRDQVSRLQSLGILAACINSEQTEEENHDVIEKAGNNEIKILYIAPERMENYEWMQTTHSLKLSMIVIDEAHCISVWGHDFRPAYRRIINLVNLLPGNFPVLATTATATLEVQKDIAAQMGGQTVEIRGNLLRENFSLRVVHVKSDDEKLAWIGMHIDALEGTGLIYTGTIVETMNFSKWLQHLNISSVNYSSRLQPDARRNVEAGLFNNQWKCVVSTNALGMGIDKPDIRFIIHTQMPQSPIHYYQEIGRAGRDGRPTDIILLYNPADRDLPEAFINGSKPPIEMYGKVVDSLKQGRLGEKQIMETTNMKQTPVRVILADLTDQGIINEVFEGSKRKYESRYGAPAFDASGFTRLRAHKFDELNKMIRYAETDGCRMKYLTGYLGDSVSGTCRNCDNDLGIRHRVTLTAQWQSKITSFWENNLPVLEVANRYSNLANGVAAAYYGNSNVGAAIHKCKYQRGGNFPDFLLKMIVKAFNKALKEEHFDLLVFVSPTESGNLVEEFAGRLSREIKVPLSCRLLKSRPTQPQKVFQPAVLKRSNIKGAFEYADPDELAGKSILLFDDICDSGATIKEIGRLLTQCGAAKITPLVIAKTVGGDLDND